MYIPEIIKKDNVPDRIKQTLDCTSVPLYDWMFDIGLHQCDLLVYAVAFDELRKEPHNPKKLVMTDMAKRIHYSVPSVCHSVDMLVDHGFLYRQGRNKNIWYSIYPFDTLDLK